MCMYGEGLSTSSWGRPGVGGPCACDASTGCDEGLLPVNYTGQHQAGPAGEWGTWPRRWG